MKLYLIEWFNSSECRYIQEYYLDIMKAAEYVKTLEDTYDDSTPEITTVVTVD